MPCVYRNSVEEIVSGGPQEIPLVQPPVEPHPPVTEASHTQTDAPHATDVVL